MESSDKKPGGMAEASFPKPPFPDQSQAWPALACHMTPRPDHGEASYDGRPTRCVNSAVSTSWLTTRRASMRQTTADGTEQYR
jgi:hypothetical protein